jgi:hypothetical protein
MMTSEALLAVMRTDQEVKDIDSESVDNLDRTDEELADHDIGFEEGLAGRPNDETKSSAWQRGWADAQE